MSSHRNIVRMERYHPSEHGGCTPHPSEHGCTPGVLSKDTTTHEAIFLDQLMQLDCRRQQLGSVFIDGVHLFSMQGNFRLSFRQVLCLGFLPYRLVLTITTPLLWIVDDLLGNFLGELNRTLMVMWQSMNRLNICYAV